MIRAALVSAPLDVPKLIGEISSNSFGAISLFIGTVRDHNDGRAVSGIEYTAYDAMARSELARIAEEASSKFRDTSIIVEHRIGEIAIGEASVVIVTASAHRNEALESTRFVIEQIKTRVPIWKREHFADGTREWVDPARTQKSVEV